MANLNEADAVDAAAARVPEAIVRAGALTQERRRNLWRADRMTIAEFQLVYSVRNKRDWPQHFVQTVHEVLRPDYPNDPPPYPLVANACDMLDVHYHEDDDDEPPFPDCVEHKQYEQALFERAEVLRHELWTAPELTVQQYHDLFGMSWCDEASEQFIFDLARQAFRETTHPVGLPTATEYLAVVKSIEAIQAR